MLQLGFVACALLLLIGNSGEAQAQVNLRMKNGVRLAGGSGPKGRLEVSSKNAWFAPYDSTKSGWSGVCDSSSFTDQLAQIMCKMLEYPYGRKWYNPKVNYKVNGTGYPLVGYIFCDATTSHRMLRGGENDVAPTNPVHARLLFTPLYGWLNTPRTAPYRCRLSPGPCDPTGPLVALECSHKPLLPAPSPPPSPPAPPPAPPAVSTSIRLYGYANHLDTPSLEPNLYENEPYLSYFSRIEVLVPNPEDVGETVWAPLCSSEEDRWSLANLVCQQAYDWPKMFDGGIDMVMAMPSQTPFAIPTDDVTTEGYFNPDTYTAWATIKGGGLTDVKRVQDLQLEVTAEPCAIGMMAVSCQAYTGGVRRS